VFRTPNVICFDLGKVLLDFDHKLMCQNVADLCGQSFEEIQTLLMKSNLHFRYERGMLSTEELASQLQEKYTASFTLPQLVDALGDIFTLNTPMIPVVASLKGAGHTVGILSNTCDAHWQIATKKFHVLNQLFDFFVLSFQAGHCKPEPEIYSKVGEVADCPLRDVLFVDDLLENVEGARLAGMDSVLYTSVPYYVDDLRKRNVRFGY